MEGKNFIIGGSPKKSSQQRARTLNKNDQANGGKQRPAL